MSIASDLRYAFRRLRQSPGFTAIAITIMGLGIGANTAIFSIVNAVLFRPQPFANADEIVRVFTSDDDGRTPGAVSYPDYLDYKDLDDIFAGFVTSNTAIVSRVTDEGSEAAFAEYVNWDFFQTLGIALAMGRPFAPEEEAPGASPAVAIVSHRLWRTDLRGDPTAVGSTIRLNGRPVTVVGVAHADYSGSIAAISTGYWIPWGTAAVIEPAAQQTLEQRGSRSLFGYGRVHEGVTAERASEALNALAVRLGEQYPETNGGRTVAVFAANDVRLHPVIDTALYPAAGLLMVVVGLVLVVACTNLANLLLARAWSRRREIAIRLAMGAGRGRLLSQLLTESAVLGIAGGMVGLGVAYWTSSAIVSFRPPVGIPLAIDLRMDAAVLAFTVILSLATGLLFGLVPALRASRPDLVPSLKAGLIAGNGHVRRWSLRNVLVIVQVATSIVLLVGAGLFVKSLVNSENVDAGFETEAIALGTLDVSLGGYDEERGRLFLDELSARLAALPGVEAVTLADRLPLGATVQTRGIRIDGVEPAEGRDDIPVDFAVVGPDYFAVMDIPLMSGRAFGATDVPGSPRVAIVSQAFAERFFGTEDVVGREIRRPLAGEPWRIVGVARDTKVRTLGEEPRPYLYVPFGQEFARFITIAMRTHGDPSPLPDAFRREVRNLDAGVPVFEAKTMTEHLGIILFVPRMAAALLSAFGLLAAALAAIGLYGVIAFSVSQRTREVGIRMALGARTSQVMRMVVGEALLLVAAGATIGLGLGALAGRGLAGVLLDVPAIEPVTFVTVSAILVIAALLATLLPARRAASVNPTEALRHE